MMKRFTATLLLAFLPLLCFLQLATSHAEEAIPARYMSILEDWDAATAEELRLNILDFWGRDLRKTDSDNDMYAQKYWPLNIRFGGNTKELIADKKNWDLAIVSSKDVDLQALADERLIMNYPNYPWGLKELYQWLLPENLQAKLPQDRLIVYDVYVYEYDVQTDDATFLICQEEVSQTNPPVPDSFARAMMWKRSATKARTAEGIRLMPDSEWSEEELLDQAEEWDVAEIIIKKGDKLELLDQAGLLYDFSQNSYFTSRGSIHPYDVHYGEDNEFAELPNGVFSTDGRMIGIPCMVTMANDDKVGMLILNAKSPYLERALAYAVHFMKSQEYRWNAIERSFPEVFPDIPDFEDIAVYKDEMDW
jgi:hypothetical protein